MKTLSIVVFAMFLGTFIMAQQPGAVVKTIKGKVINASTNEPVSYTNIGLEGTYFGTASDGEGNFELKIPEELISKNIFFSAVGFTNNQFPVKNLFAKEFNVVKIEPQSYGIDKIDIAAQNRVLIRILRMAKENIPYNFIQGPHNLIGEYRNEKTVNNKIRKQNAEVLIYDQNGYSQPSKIDAFQSRKYSIQKEKSEEDYQFSTGTTNMDELLELDWVRSASSVLNPILISGFQLSLESEPVINGKECWQIFFKQNKPTLPGSGDFYASSFEGKITIIKEDYSIQKIEGQVQSPKNNRQGKSLAIGNTNTDYFKDVSYNFSIQYENLNPELITLNKTYTNKNEKVSESSTLKITQVKATGLTTLKNRDYFTGK